MTRPDVLVVGGGPAGAAAAIRLARSGARVDLYERQREAHDKVCGEFLSVEALRDLEELDVDRFALGALALTHVGLAGPHASEAAAIALPFAAASLPRKLLDEALLERAARAGVHVVRGESVRPDSACVREAGSVFVATGKHDWQGRPRPRGVQPDLLAFKMYFRVQSACSPRVDLIPFERGYAGLQPVGERRMNLCLLVHRAHYETLGSWTALLGELIAHSPYLAHVLRDATACWSKPLALGKIPYGYVRAASQDRAYWLGDQAAVIPSFAGDGISIALHSARRATDAWLGGISAAEYQRALARELGGQVRRATWVSRLLVQPWFQPVAALTARALPYTVRAIAEATRVSAHAT